MPHFIKSLACFVDFSGGAKMYQLSLFESDHPDNSNTLLSIYQIVGFFVSPHVPHNERKTKIKRFSFDVEKWLFLKKKEYEKNYDSKSSFDNIKFIVQSNAHR